jgi:hypothetical protein
MLTPPTSNIYSRSVVLLAELHCRRLHQPQDSPLGCRRAGCILGPVFPLHRRKQDEAALPPRQHFLEQRRVMGRFQNNCTPSLGFRTRELSGPLFVISKTNFVRGSLFLSFPIGNALGKAYGGDLQTNSPGNPTSQIIRWPFAESIPTLQRKGPSETGTALVERTVAKIPRSADVTRIVSVPSSASRAFNSGSARAALISLQSFPRLIWQLLADSAEQSLGTYPRPDDPLGKAFR